MASKQGDRGSFQVMALRRIGEVQLSETGLMSPVEAAMAMIGKDGDPGEYSFTIPAGMLDPSQPDLRFDISIKVNGEASYG